MVNRGLHLMLVAASLCLAMPAQSQPPPVLSILDSSDLHQDKAEPTLFRTQGSSSEANSAAFDALYDETKQSGRPVIVVSRLGIGETGLRLHERRLHNAVERLTSSGRRLSRSDVLATIGPRLKGRGGIEVYIGGQLRFVSEIGRGKDLLVDCCESFPEYYPEYKGKRLFNFF